MRNPHAGEPFDTSGRGDRRGAARRVDPDAPALARPHVRRSGDHPRAAPAGRALPQRGAGLHDRGGQGRGPGARPRRHPRLPGPGLPRARAGLARAAPRDDDVAGLRGRARGVRPAADGGDGARRPRRPTGRAGRHAGRARRPSRWWSSAAGSPACWPGSGSRRPASRSPSSRRTPASAAPGGRTPTPAPGSTSATTSTATRFEPSDHWTEYFARQPELQALLRVGHGQARHRAPRAVGDRGARRHLGRRRRPPGRCAPGPPTGPRTCLDGPGRDLGGGPAQPAERPRRSRARTPSPDRRSTRPAGTTTWTWPASGWP